jgi:hypothetical protein
MKKIVLYSLLAVICESLRGSNNLDVPPLIEPSIEPIDVSSVESPPLLTEKPTEDPETTVPTITIDKVGVPDPSFSPQPNVVIPDGKLVKQIAESLDPKASKNSMSDDKRNQANAVINW